MMPRRTRRGGASETAKRIADRKETGPTPGEIAADPELYGLPTREKLPTAYAKFCERALVFPPIFYTLTTLESRGLEWWTKHITRYMQAIAAVLDAPTGYIAFFEPQKRGATHAHGMIQTRGQWTAEKLTYVEAALIFRRIGAPRGKCGDCDFENTPGPAHAHADIQRARFDRKTRTGEQVATRYCTKYIAKGGDMMPPTIAAKPDTEERRASLTRYNRAHGAGHEPPRPRKKAPPRQPPLELKPTREEIAAVAGEAAAKAHRKTPEEMAIARQELSRRK